MNLQVWEISKKFRNWCYGYLLVRVILSGDGGQRKAGILTGAPVAMRDIRPCSGWMLRGSHRRHKLVDIEYGPPLPETKPPGHRQTLEVKFSSEFHWVFQSTELHQAWSSWSLSLGGMEEGHDDHCLAFFFLSYCLGHICLMAWLFLQNKEYGKAGDTAAIWPRDRWCSYFRSCLRRPQKKLRRQLLLFIEKTVPYNLCGDFRKEAHFP